jgi:alkyldihydroxyacetonephosphate synthase
MRWWGWGEDGHAVPLPPAAEALLRDELGADPELRRPPVAFEQVSLPEPRLGEAAKARLVAAVGAEHVRDDRETRIAHAVGRSYPDLVRIRSGDAASAPDAVVLPESAEQVAAVLAACSEQRVAVVPFGGGTSVVGGVEPVREASRPRSRWT